MSDFESVTPDLWVNDEEGWKEKLLKLPNWYQIPLINSNASHNLADNSLVRFRGMIQDMRNPNFYFEKFEVYNTVTKEIKIKSGKYRETAHISENEKINYTENLKSGQFESMVVVSMPGLNKWAQQIEDDRNHLRHLEEQPNTSKRLLNTNKMLKRSYDETEDDDAMEVVENKTVLKEQRTFDDINSAVSREHLLNFPLPDVSSKSCIVKIYEENNTLKINDMIEVVGFLSVDPILSGEFRPGRNVLEAERETDMKIITHNPPPSLIPRVHAVYVKKLEHCNPLVKDEFDQGAVVVEAREHLLKALTELLLGDQLAAEYLICHLIASVYLRQEVDSFGQFCLNLSNLPIQKYPDYAKQLYDIIKQFVTKSYYLPFTIDNMNTLTLLPKKDYECNRLTSGVLQLSNNTHLVIDETKLEQGQLNATGVNNVAALSNLIKTQRVEYDFKYYKMEFESNIPVLIFSAEGRSLLPSDYYVPMRAEESSLQLFDAIVEAATYYLKDEIMNLIRVYITNLKLAKCAASEDYRFVEDDFVEMRSKSDSNNPVTVKDLHRLLVLARLLSLSKGFNTLNRECWDIAKAMETERLYRVANRET